MSQFLSLLFGLACPLGMAAMMAGPALARRFRRPGRGPSADHTDRIGPGMTLAKRPASEARPGGGR
jgi:hypothetical protein